MSALAQPLYHVAAVPTETKSSKVVFNVLVGSGLDPREEIRSLLEDRPDLDEFDIANELNLGFEATCSILDEMVRDGVVKRA